MVDDPKKGPSVYQWDGASKQWQYIGEIMGEPNDDKRPQIDGVYYDYVTQIDVNGDNVKVPLGFNKDDDPRQISRDFCVIHSIDLDLALRIEEHLRPMADPIARRERLERERIAAQKQLRHIPSFKRCAYETHAKLKLSAMKKKLTQLNAEVLASDDENVRELGIA